MGRGDGGGCGARAATLARGLASAGGAGEAATGDGRAASGVRAAACAVATCDGSRRGSASRTATRAGVTRNGAAKSSPMAPFFPIGITPPQTEQRARMPASGTRFGSTRKTVPHSPHRTFMAYPHPR